jgi:bacillithiol biosynthesis cysteine-adding enzyme BshC
MPMHSYKRSEISFSGKLIELFSEHQESLQPLIGLPFSAENFKKQIALKSNFSEQSRAILYHAILNQYNEAQLEAPEKLTMLLENNCYTVCTGHQLNLFTGPLYTIYKIAHTIKLAQQIQELHPGKRILPIFWLASEDHDLEEINHLHIGDKKIQWSTQQSGPVGVMHLENWSEWQTELTALFPNQAEKLTTLFDVYRGDNLSIATRRLVAHLFHDTDLVLVDGNDTELKKLFVPILEKELNEQFSFHEAQKSEVILNQKNLKAQAFAREINLFHLSPGKRIRIEKSGDDFKIGERTFTRRELLDLLHQNPEQFSPNVMLRPLYQECVLPNLCYVGGAGELAYWLQLKPIFDAVDVPYPMLQLRVSMQLMLGKDIVKMSKLGFDFPKFSDKKERVLKEHLLEIRERKEARSALQRHIEALEKIMLEQASAVDHTLIASAKAESSRIQKLVDNFLIKLERNEKRLHHEALDRLRVLHEKHFPNDGLQERHENFISFYLETQGQIIPEIIKGINALQSDFWVCEV